MRTPTQRVPDGRLALVVVFAAAMAWVEASAVVYLRLHLGRLEPHQPDPQPLAGGLGRIELVREAATLVMIAAIGALAGRSAWSRFGAALVAFGVWDLLYYAFLRVQCDWPRSLLDWDVLFLLPLPWWGPVAAPASIAALLIVGGVAFARGARPDAASIAAGAAGALLALYVFMADAIAALPQGVDAVRRVLPERFPWPLFAISWIAMAVPVARAVTGGVARGEPRSLPVAGRSAR